MSFSQGDADDTAAICKQLEELKRENVKLQSETESFRSQYEEAMSIVKQMEPLYAQNAQLTRDLRLMKAERDDLERRLQISIQRIGEMKETAEKVTIQKVSAAPATNNDELESVIKQKERESGELMKQNVELQKQLREEHQLVQQREREMSCILQSARTYFKADVPSFARLCKLFERTKATDEKPKEVERDAYEQLLRELRKSTKALKKERKARRGLEEQLKEMDESSNKAVCEHKKTVQKLEAELASLREEAESREETEKQRNEQQEARIKGLEASLEKQRELLKAAEEKEPVVIKDDSLKVELQSLKRKSDATAAKLSEANNNIVVLRKQNAQLAEQIKGSEGAKEKLIQQVDAAKKEVEDLKSKLKEAELKEQKLAQEKEELQGAYDIALSQVKTAKYSAKQSEEASIEAHGEIQKMAGSINLLKESYEVQKREMSTLYSDRDKLILLVNKQNSLLKASEDHLQFLKAKIKVLKRERMNEAQQEQPKPVVADIPFTCWLCPEFPSELSLLVEDLAKNSMPASAKLRQGLLTIARYYNNKLDGANKATTQANELAGKYSKIGERLATEMTTALDISNLTFSAIVYDPNQIMELVQKISSLKSELNLVNGKNLQLAADIKLLLDDVNTESVADADEAIRKLQDENEVWQRELMDLSSKIKKAQQGAKKTMTFFEAQIQELKRTVEEKDEAIEAMEKVQASLKESLREAEKRNATLQNDIKENETIHTQSLDERDAANRAAISQLSSQFEVARNEMSDRITHLSNKLAEKDKIIAKLGQDVSQWQKTSRLLTEAKKAHEKEIEELKAQAVEDEKLWTDRLKREKEQIKEQWEKTVASLKKRNQEMQQVVDNTLATAKQVEDKKRSMIARTKQLSMEKDQLSSRLSSLTEELERQMQLHATKLKAVSLSAETACHNKIDEVKSQCEVEKQQIYALAASLFRKYYDARKQLNKDEYDMLLRTVANELSRLAGQEANLRRLLGLDSTEPLDKAVSSLMMSLCHH